MKFLVLITLIMASSAWAKCPAKVRSALAPQKKLLTVTSDSYRSFGRLLFHYRSELQPSFPVKIESLVERSKNGKVTGYEIGITDQSDEAFVRYVTDAKRRPLVAYWSNQSPLTFWFCESRTAVETEDTVDGAEIF